MRKTIYYLFGISPKYLNTILNSHSDESGFSDFEIDNSSPYGELILRLKNKKSHAVFASNMDYLNPYLFSESNSLPDCLVELLKSKNQTLSVAESCTGGRISALITGVPGASSVFDSGIVTYSNKAKEKFLKVEEKILIENGAVSQQTAEAMVSGLLNESQTDLGIAVTGIAGPSGGTEEKPNGTVFIGWGNKNKIEIQRFLIPLERHDFQNKVSFIALNQLRRFLLQENLPIHYHFDQLQSGVKVDSLSG